MAYEALEVLDAAVVQLLGHIVHRPAVLRVDREVVPDGDTQRRRRRALRRREAGKIGWSAGFGLWLGVKACGMQHPPFAQCFASSTVPFQAIVLEEFERPPPRKWPRIPGKD